MVLLRKYMWMMESGYFKFINIFYDDEGWWVLVWIRLYDLIKKIEYFSMVESIFDDMRIGVDIVCGGGILWNKMMRYKVVIVNEFYFIVVVSFVNWVQGFKDYYFQIVREQWEWFKKSGLINKDNLINDGFNSIICFNNNEIIWFYNQGVILGGLVEFSKVVGNDLYFLLVVDIVEVVIVSL